MLLRGYLIPNLINFVLQVIILRVTKESSLWQLGMEHSFTKVLHSLIDIILFARTVIYNMYSRLLLLSSFDRRMETLLLVEHHEGILLYLLSN